MRREHFNNMIVSNKMKVVEEAGEFLIRQTIDLEYFLDLYIVDVHYVEVWVNRLYMRVDRVYIPTYKELDHIVKKLDFTL